MLTLSIVVCVLMLAALCMQLGRDLMMLQQNSYRDERYARWLSEARESTRYDRLIGYIVFFAALVPSVSDWISMSAIGVFGLWNFVRLAGAKYKKPLVFTSRAVRMYATSLVVTLVVLAVPFVFVPERANLQGVDIFMVLAYCISDVILRVANWLLKPVEKHINNRYYREAQEMLQGMPELIVVGVTGSYGKTSTKHYLNRILSEKYDVLMTPGNFNTTLGVVRTVREYMKPYNQVFIVEMGAKQRGDIKEICDLVHPTIGVVTAVGPMHLETFGSIEAVQATKFELVDSLPADGLAVVNNDFDYIANREVANVACKRYAVDPSRVADFHATDILYTGHGTQFTISDAEGPAIQLHTRLVGECNVSNLIAAVIVALHLGVDKHKIAYAVEKIEQVEHRLNMKRLPNGLTLIDDAYNSNPIGSKMALDVLAAMTQGRRFVITPGMIELGDEQYELNEKLGLQIAKCADVAIIVGEYNREAILEGAKKGGMAADCLHIADTFDQAQQLMLSMANPGDTVLYENDLPDTFK